MATLSQGNPTGERRPGSSPRPKGRENAKDTLCRNVTIYGHCRYEDKGCAFNHDPSKLSSHAAAQAESAKKRFNADSPAFTPSVLAANGTTNAFKATGFSPRAASAAPFNPKGFVPAQAPAPSTPSAAYKSYNPNAPDFLAPDETEYLTQSFNNISTSESQSAFNQPSTYEQFNTNASAPNNASTEHEVESTGFVNDTNGFAQNIYQPSVGNQVLHHHLYVPLEPLPQVLQPNQRTAKDFFIPENLRQILQDKAETTLRSFGNSIVVAPYHTLTQLIEPTTNKINSFGYESTVYKAVDSRDGRTYCLRRIHNFIMDEITIAKAQAVKSVWSSITNSSVVPFQQAFTTQEMGDRSLILVTDYHANSVTLAQAHISVYGASLSRRNNSIVPEKVIWNYLSQITNALKAIHGAGMAARMIDTNKFLLTDEDRIRYNGAALADILDPTSRSLVELQSMDFEAVGNLIVWLATFQPRSKPVDLLLRAYQPRLVRLVEWLVEQDSYRSIDSFVELMSSALMDSFDSSLRADDVLQFNLNRELENSRLVRLMVKMNAINERPEYEEDPAWSEYGPRAQIKLFRDYVFHQVDAQGRPVLDLGHVLSSLNKLDVGLEERIPLSTRDGKTVIVVSFREVKQMIESAWMELMRRSRS